MHAIDGKGLLILTGLLPNLKNGKQLSLASAPGLADFEAHVLFTFSFSFSSKNKQTNKKMPCDQVKWNFKWH